MAKPFDATTKWLVDLRPADWLALIGLAGAEGEPFEPEIVDADLAAVTADADRVIRIRTPDEAEALVDLEFVVGHHGQRTAAVLLLYSTLLGHRYGLPVRSVAVLLRREADSPPLPGVLERLWTDGSVYHVFTYQVLRVWELDVEVVLSGGMGTLPLAPLANVSLDDLPAIVRRMEQRIEAEAAPGVAAELWTATLILMGMRYERAVVQRLLKGVRQMRESTTYMAILEEGLEQGLQQGLQQGLERGRTEGERQSLLRVGTLRFGAPSAETRSALEAIDSAEDLLALVERALQVESWEELLAPYTRRG